jgi:hypothetical protein
VLRFDACCFSVVDGGAASVAFVVARAPALSSAALCRKFRRVLFILSPEIPLMLGDADVALAGPSNETTAIALREIRRELFSLGGAEAKD